MPSARLSAKERLSKLERVFSVDDFQQQQDLSAKAASVYLARWQAQGHIGRLGPRCGIWVNFLTPKGPEIDWEDRAQGVFRKHPQAIVGAESALRAWDWMPPHDQAPLDLLIPQGQSRAHFDRMVLHLRTPRTHALLWALARPHPRMVLHTLPPDVAVADLVAQGQEVPLALRQRAGDISSLVRRLGGHG